MTAEMSVQITLALSNIIYFIHPSAENGKQNNFKHYRLIALKVQVLSRINVILIAVLMENDYFYIKYVYIPFKHISYI